MSFYDLPAARLRLLGLLHEQDVLSVALARSRRRLLRLVEDRAFLLDRLERHEKPKKGRPPGSGSKKKNLGSTDEPKPKRKYRRRKPKQEQVRYKTAELIPMGVHEPCFLRLIQGTEPSSVVV